MPRPYHRSPFKVFHIMRSRSREILWMKLFGLPLGGGLTFLILFTLQLSLQKPFANKYTPEKNEAFVLVDGWGIIQVYFNVDY